MNLRYTRPIRWLRWRWSRLTRWPRTSPPPTPVRIYWVERLSGEESPTAAEINAGLEITLKDTP